LHTVRDLSRLLHPAVLDDIGLAAAVEAYVREFRKRYDMPIDFSVEGLEFRLDSQAEAAAYRIVQEALTNIARHASASSCRIRLRRLGAEVQLIVEDDGVGFDPEAQRSGRVEKGLGLLGMQERVSRLGGSCIVDSAPGSGTRVMVTLPLASDESAPRTIPSRPPDRAPGSVLGRLAGA
jgi:signal transduction histidine kinase